MFSGSVFCRRALALPRSDCSACSASPSRECAGRSARRSRALRALQAATPARWPPERLARHRPFARPLALAGRNQDAVRSEARCFARARGDQDARARHVPGGSPRSGLVIPPEEIDQFVCFWEGLPEAPGQPGRSPFIPPPSGIIYRSTKAQDWKSRLMHKFGRVEEFRLDGQTCFRLGQPPIPGWCAARIR